jgi:two-component sensor histidine kinase
MLRARLVLLVLAAVLPLLALQLGSIYFDFRASRAAAVEQALTLARGIAQAVDNAIRTRIAILEVLALSRSLAVGDIAAFRNEAEAVVARQLPGAAILLLREDGQQVMNTEQPLGAPLLPRTNLENQRQVFATGRPSVSNLHPGIVVRRPTIAIEVPVRRADGSISHVLALNPALDAFNRVIERQPVGDDLVIAVMDRAGVRVARVPDPDRFIGHTLPETAQRSLTVGNEGHFEAISPEGIPLVAAFHRLPELGWMVAVGQPLAQLTGPAWRRALTFLAVGLGVLGLGLVLAHQVARGITGPITRLRALATVPAEGDAVPIDTGLPETDEVGEALLSEARHRRAAMASLIDSERRLRLVIAELNHRAKNALATVQSLAQQTVRGEAGTDPVHFATAFNARLQSLARAHDLLTAFGWENAALDAVVRAGVAPWIAAGDGAAPRVAVDCDCGGLLPPVSPGQAQALVMPLHELASNAARLAHCPVPPAGSR